MEFANSGKKLKKCKLSLSSILKTPQSNNQTMENFIKRLQENQEMQIKKGIRESEFPNPVAVPSIEDFITGLNEQTEKADMAAEGDYNNEL